MKKIDQEAYIFSSILTLSNRIQTLGDKLDEKMTLKQWMVLAMLSKCDKQTATISQIAKNMGSSRQNIKKMALILEKSGFLTIRSDVNDARVSNVTLTEQCQAYFVNRDARETAFINNLFSDCDDDLVNGLYKGLIKLNENINNMEA